jgi:hypothetical protein
MFDCRACAAKDAEIARLWKALTDANDRFQALTGTLSEVANNRAMEDEPDVPDTGAPDTEQAGGDETAWAEGELERKALEIRTKGGRVRPDFPI